MIVKSELTAFSVDIDPYIMSPSTPRRNSIVDLRDTHGKIYAKDSSLIVYYCRNEAQLEVVENKMLHWLVPFQTTLWIVCLMLLAIPSLITFCLSKSASDSVAVVFGVVGVVLKQYTSVVYRKLLVFTSFSALIICSFYESQITSLATIHIPSPTIQSLPELFGRGYKILKHKEVDLGSFYFDFRARKLQNVLNTSFFTYASKFDDYRERIHQVVKLLATSNQNLSYAAFDVDETAQFQVWYKTELIRRETRDADYYCYSLPEKLKTSQDYWNINVKNKYWLEMSMRFLHSSGLHQIWDSWSDWALTFDYMLDERNLQEKGKWLGESLFHKKKLGPALIRIDELGGFLLLASCPILLSIVLFVLEIYTKYRDDNVAGNRLRIIIEFKTYRSTCLYPVFSKFGD
ncbi:unnamed protein product [Orchesella dallaii]|uniref:Uncharacterized protein n=1 Tax=Orchesella dallaii TaxID=48710 RepID=A0ABP1RLQ8_9HEXA